MGKASRNLSNNLVVNNAKNNCKYADDEGRAKLPQKTPERIQFEKIYDTSLSIQKQLSEYAQKKGVPMCEYLSRVELENYVTWMQKK